MGKRVRVSRREGMAARGGIAEETMNNLVLQFYFHQAMAAYRCGRNRDFRQLRDVMQGGPGPAGGMGGGAGLRSQAGREGGRGRWEGAGLAWGGRPGPGRAVPYPCNLPLVPQRCSCGPWRRSPWWPRCCA